MALDAPERDRVTEASLPQRAAAKSRRTASTAMWLRCCIGYADYVALRRWRSARGLNGLAHTVFYDHQQSDSKAEYPWRRQFDSGHVAAAGENHRHEAVKDSNFTSRAAASLISGWP